MSIPKIKEVHEQVLAFLLNWRAQKDPQLLFTLRRRPEEKLKEGFWFLGSATSLTVSFWTGLDTVNKTQNIYIEIESSGATKLRFTARDHQGRAEIFTYAASVLGGFVKTNRSNIWTKEYEGSDYIRSLAFFLEYDKQRIDFILENERKRELNSAFAGGALSNLNPAIFKDSLELIHMFREKNKQPVLPSSPVQKELVLQKLQIANMGLFNQCEVDFGARATLFIGENGCGKTTLLRAAALGMIGTGSTLIDTSAYELQQFPRIEGVEDSFRLQYAGGGAIRVSYLYNGSLFDNGRSNVISFTPPGEAGKVSFEDRIDEKGVGLPVGEVSESELPVLIIGYPQRYGGRRDQTKPDKRPKEPNAYDLLPLILNQAENRFETLSLWIAGAWNSGKQALVNGLFVVISSILSENEDQPFTIRCMSAATPEEIVVSTPANPQGIPFSLLSTGLNNLFGWVGHLMSRMYDAYPQSDYPLHEPAVVLIDEIDNYLHPEVQVKLMGILLDTFPKAQFIFTAHSPVILAALPNTDTKAYRIADGKVEEVAHFYGRTIQDILYEWFGLTPRVAPEIEQKLKEMTRVLSSGPEESARIYQELLPVLGENDAAMMYVQKKLKL